MEMESMILSLEQNQSPAHDIKYKLDDDSLLHDTLTSFSMF